MLGLSMFMLLRREAKVPTPRWTLLVMCTILFLLCTVHVGASLQQLLDAFIYVPADVPDYSTTYWLVYTTTLRVLKDNLYVTVVFTQDAILIWRLHVVFMYDWRVVILPIIFAVGRISLVYAASAVSTLPNDGSLTTSLIISGWAIGLILTVSITGAIVARLWRMGRPMSSLTSTSTNRFASSIYLIMQSGAISVVAGTTVAALFASSNPASFSGLDVICQLIVWGHLLIPSVACIELHRFGRYWRHF
jgi:hypothetical protein